MKVFTAACVLLTVLLFAEPSGPLQSLVPADHPVFFGLFLCILVFGIAEAAKHFCKTVAELSTRFGQVGVHVSASKFVLSVTLMSGVCSIVGCLPYILFDATTPIPPAVDNTLIVDPTWYDDRVNAAWVKLGRVAVMGFTAGFILSVILTEYISIRVSKSFSAYEKFFDYLKLAMLLAAIGVSYWYIGTKLSDIGLKIEALFLPILSPMGVEHIPFGSAVCSSLAEYFSHPKDPFSTRNICDVGRIDFVLILISIGLCSLAWMASITHLFRGQRDKGLFYSLKRFCSAEFLLLYLVLGSLVVSFGLVISPEDISNFTILLSERALGLLSVWVALSIVLLWSVHRVLQVYEEGDTQQ